MDQLTNIEEFREMVIDSYSSYKNVIRNSDTSWCDEGIKRAKEATTMKELETLDETIEKAWDNIDY